MSFCPQCGIENPANARFCDQCGAALIPVPGAAAPAPLAPPQQPVPQSASTSAAPAVSTTSGSLTCPQCGTAAIPGEAFCDNCGAPLNAPARPAAAAATGAPQAVGVSPPYQTGLPPQPTYPAPQPTSFGAAQTLPGAAASPASGPGAVPAPSRAVLSPARLVVASSGAALPLPSGAQAIVGRADPISNFFPDVDLNPYDALEHGVGRRHIRVFVQHGQVMVEDLDSTNGSALNGQKLAPRQPQPLRDGDQLVVGKLLLRFEA